MAVAITDLDFGYQSGHHSSTWARHYPIPSEPVTNHSYYLEDFDEAIEPTCVLRRQLQCHLAVTDDSLDKVTGSVYTIHRLAASTYPRQ